MAGVPSSEMLSEEVCHRSTDLHVLADEVVVGRQFRDRPARIDGSLDDRFPVHRRVALAVDHLGRTPDSFDGIGHVSRVDDGVRRGQNGECVRLGVAVGGRQYRHAGAEAIAEGSDRVEPVAGPVEGRVDVALLGPALVPGTVVVAEAGDAAVGEGVADGRESLVGPGAAHLGVGRGRYDDGVGVLGAVELVGPIEGRGTVAGPGKAEAVGHGYRETC